RMKLQLAMGKPDEQTLKDLRGDVEEMEYMIQEYLDFARGEGQETSLTVNVEPFLQEIVERYQRNAQPVTLEPLNDISLPLRPNAMRRALQNVIDNALRYGKQARIHVTSEDYELRISIDDEGPGINEEDHNTVFRAFKRLDPSRNNETGGAGLGLTIARDIVQGHGGDVVLKNREDGEGKRLGLRVSLILPMARQQPAH
ncbi:MAG: two-component sensor histidine kinase, partial [Rickettsiales bacterium]|nr:two-component sensor histidine kinase [Rickettsiales bacterium]